SAAPKTEKGRRRSFRLNWRRMIRRTVETLTTTRMWLLAVGHLVLFLAIYWTAFALRFEFSIPSGSMTVFWASLPWVLGLKLVVFFALGHYHGWWRYVTFADLAALLRASLLSLLLVALLDYFLWPYQVPRSILILDCMLGIILLGSLRASWRLFNEHFRPVFGQNDFRGALLVGDDHSSRLLAHQIHSRPELPYRIRGFLATNNIQKGTRWGRIPVLGVPEDVREIAASCGATEVLATAGTLPGNRLRCLMDACHEAGLNLKIIPPMEDLFNGNNRIPLRDIDINDLLRRDPVKLDTAAIADLLDGRTVMVTGAGGSIGSEICRQVLKFNPKEIVLVGRGENRIFHVEMELRRKDPTTALYPRIADVTDHQRMRQLFEEFRPEVIFHAAAHKHVPLMEANVGEAIKNNISGTKCVADLADEFDAAGFVLVSTDKAVRPSSVMGVSKQIAERYVHTMSQESATKFVVTRFGNVLGSQGSVVPIFQEQIRRGGPITITHAQMERFFMTIPEASQLVLQAAAMGRGGEIFVLDMGDPVKIVDLARDLIRLSGLPEHAIEVTFTGIRPGEKLFEELYFDDEETLPTSHPKLRAAYHRPYSFEEVHEAIVELERLVHGPEEVLREKLREIVPEYQSPSAAESRKVESEVA
ncbi:MAG TPA: nucleoside-diphosphate sugar epimerase/dehydratase, partial [Thermoguttaceae bacterium]|nr:nucleoside-diphosphate sugar epimerase/dehydratase [Thermoguttaceae bacterium]